MKHQILNFTKIIIVLLALVSCENDLDLVPETTRTAANFFRNADDIETAVNAVYGGLQRNHLYGWNYHIAMEQRADNTGEQFLQNDIDQFIRNTSNGECAGIWSGSYLVIQASNTILNRIDGIGDIDASIKSSRKGEMKFVRALLYYNLINLFGDVPLVVEETTNPNEAFGVRRAPVEEVSNQIIKDLMEASNELPSTNENGRPAKDAANTLLGKVYLMVGNYQKAEEALRLVIDPNKWTAVYADLFGIENENNKSSFFEIEYASGINGGTEGSLFATRFRNNGNPGAKGQNILTSEFVEAFESGDLRKDQVIADVNSGTDRIISTKYRDLEADPNDGGNNVIVLRYADAVLMLAEALNGQSYVPDGEAFELLNLTRTRAGLPNLTSETITNQNEFKAALLKERRFEFFYELHRWFDLKRLGDPVQVMNDHFEAIGENITIDSNDLLLPIPQNQIDVDPEYLTQNPGY